MATKENIQKLAAAKLIGQRAADFIYRLIAGEAPEAIISSTSRPLHREPPVTAGAVSTSSSSSLPAAPVSSVSRIPRPHSGEPSKTTLFVANLPFNFTDADLMSLFKDFHPKEARIAVRRDRRSRGYGFVSFENEQNMQDALKAVDKKLVAEREISVRVVLGEGQRTERSRAPRVDSYRAPRPYVSSVPYTGELSKTVAFVGNLPYQVDDSKLASLLSGYKCQPPKISRRPDGSSLGFALVTFETEVEQARAISALHNSHFEGRTLNVQASNKGSRPPRSMGTSYNTQPNRPFNSQPPFRSAPRQPRIPQSGEPSKTTLFVANLPYIVDDNGLLQIFEGFNVKEAHVPRRRNGYSTGYGFVTLGTEEEAQRALKEVDKSLVEKREISVRQAYNRPSAPAAAAVAPVTPVAVPSAPVSETPK
jgi:RNA recognition motif-containing protein